MREAVVVSTALTPIGRAYRAALNNIKSPTMIEDVVVGSVLTAGTSA